MKFRDGYMIKSGDPVNHYIDTAVRHIKLKQGVMGIQVKIMLPYEPDKKKAGSHVPQPDVVVIHEPKTEDTLPVPPKQGYAQPAGGDVQTPGGLPQGGGTPGQTPGGDDGGEEQGQGQGQGQDQEQDQDFE